MPTYDVACFACGHEESLMLSISKLDAWDKEASCPSCHKGEGTYRRVIRASAISSSPDNWSRYANRTKEPDKVASAFEAVKTGKFEGF